MLQNRVDPFGNFIATSARGSFMGNRGVIHKDKKDSQAVQSQSLDHLFVGVQREEKSSDDARPLDRTFFLDEATAFAAGHRPCFECRREDAQRFKSFWIKGNPEHRFTLKTSIQQIDNIIHAERIDREKRKVTHQRKVVDIPNGTFVLVHDQPFMYSNNKLHRWTPFGYEESISMDSNSLLTVLTPSSVVNTFVAGYVPQIKAE